MWSSCQPFMMIQMTINNAGGFKLGVSDETVVEDLCRERNMGDSER